MLHDYSEAERAADHFRSAESGFRFLGSVHTHPYWDSTKPSSSDRRWALDFSSWRELDAGPFGLSLIVTPDRERGWSRPHFAAWATRRTSAGTAVTEPARIVE